MYVFAIYFPPNLKSRQINKNKIRCQNLKCVDLRSVKKTTIVYNIILSPACLLHLSGFVCVGLILSSYSHHHFQTLITIAIHPR